MTGTSAGGTERRFAGVGLTLRLTGVMLLVFACASAAFVLIARNAIENARAQQLADARSHFIARIASLEKVWQHSGYAVAQQLEVWQAGAVAATSAERDARLRALLVTLLDQGDFAHAVVADAVGGELLRHGTRSQDRPALPAAGAAGGWVYSAPDRTVYRTVDGPLRYGDQAARLILYVPLDRALLSRLVYPNTQLALLRDGEVLVPSDLGSARAGGGALGGESARLELPWDSVAGAPTLRIERRFVTPLSTGQLGGVVAACALAFLVLGWFVIGRWMRGRALRLQALQEASTAFAAAPAVSSAIGQRLDAAAAPDDDIGRLARDLRTMMARIEQARDEQAAAREALAALNAGLEDRVAARTRELEQARDEALSAARAKEQFLSNMSHEIRTPMNGMLGALELMSVTELTALQTRYLGVAVTSGEALMSIINEVLDFAKISAGRLELVREPIDVNAIARSVTTLFSASAQRKGLELRLDADAAVAGWRLGDALRLRQVLMNLVGNAMKFTQQGSVVVATRRVAAGIAFEVRDSGIGIDASQHERIFEPFVQADDPARQRQGGTGLGLAISRQLVLAMGGELGVESRVGDGTTFRFVLPLAEAPRHAEAPAPAANDAAPAALHGRVLLVEDNSVNRMVGSAMLESLGLEVVLAEHGEEALEALARMPVQAVLMDCQMPVMDGYEATHRLRATERQAGAPRLPVIALTANALSGDVERCLAAGMDAHLAKPYTLAQLAATLTPWLAVPNARPAGA